MSQTKNTDNSPKTNSDEIARSIIQPIVDQAAGDSKGGGTKPPLHHNNQKSDTNNNSQETKPKSNSKDDQHNNNKTKSKSSSNDNFVFHPNHPGKMYELSSVSSADNSDNPSPNPTPDPKDLHQNKTSQKQLQTDNKNDNERESKDNNNNANNVSQNQSSKNNNNTSPKENSRNGSSNKNNETSKKDSSKPKKEETDTTHSHTHASTSRHDRSGKSNSSLRGIGGSSSSLSREQRRERRRKLEDPNCFPKRFEVQVQARVRVGMDLSSQHLTDLPEGSVVTVEEIINRRARISRPLCGWLSVTSKFGARIILPTNSKYSKIGGKVMFKRPIQGQQLLANGQYPNQAKIVDYNEENSLYKVNYEDGNTQWIDLDNPNVQFISQHKAVKVQKPLDGAAPTFTLQTSQAFFNQFFCKDYPQYQAQSSSTTRHMDISPVAIPSGQSRFTRFPGPHNPLNGPPHGNHPPHLNGPPGPNHGPPPGNHAHGPHGPQPPYGHPPQTHGPPTDGIHGRGGPNNPPHGHYPPRGPHPGYGPPPPHHGPPPPHGYPPHHGHGPPPHHAGNGNMGPVGPYGPPPPGHHPHGPPPTRGPPIPPRGGPYPPPHNQPPPDGHGQMYGNHRDPRGDPRNNPPNVTNGASKMTDDRGKSNKSLASDLPKTTNEEFVNKVKEIERRIIQHLHQRGYDESHPDYHRYLQKAKELAIQKAGKEREKMLQQQRELQQQQNANATSKGVTRQEYEQYMRYRQEKQRQHAIAEQQRKARLAEQAAAQQRAAAAAAAVVGSAGGGNNPNNKTDATGGGNKLTSPSKSSGSVKGLIVLRGLPGSGKTTLAKKLAQRSKNARICTEDRYHWSGKEDGVGEYKFQPQLVFLAREWCTKEIRECIQNNVNLIILDNHNARISMYEDHIQYAVEHGYRFRIIEFVATASLIDKYRARSYKKFPREVYVKLLKLWEHDPRTELINPTFGDNDNNKVVIKKETGVNKTSKINDNDNGNDDINNKEDKPSVDVDESNEKPVEQESNNKNNLIDYSRRPLDQGLNISNKLNNNEKQQ